MKRIKVRVIKMSGRPSLVAEWRDPVTGKLKRQATGEKVRRDAERHAARLEKELNEGRQADYRTTWEAFRARYETEVLAFKRKATAVKAGSCFNAIEEHISPKFVRALDAGELSKLSAKLQGAGLAEASIASTLRTIKAALRWAARLRLIPEAPHITMPSKATAKAGGRAVTSEEFERMLEAVRKVVWATACPENWILLLKGLWWSGLRIQEAYRLHWIDDRELTIDTTGKRPMFLIKAKADKGRKDRRFPMAKEFADLLETIPEEDRTGYVFSPTIPGGKRATFDVVSRTIARIGRKAGVVVEHNVKGDAVTASAHDLRRAFGTRWAKRVMPPVLKQLMRHESITTTLTFYVDQNADDAASEAWAASIKAEDAQTTIETIITVPSILD
jgi:integrase